MEGAKPTLPVLYGPQDVCQITGVSRRTLRRLVSAGLFPSGLKIGKRRVWHPDELNEYLKTASQVKRSKARQ